MGTRQVASYVFKVRFGAKLFAQGAMDLEKHTRLIREPRESVAQPSHGLRH